LSFLAFCSEISFSFVFLHPLAFMILLCFRKYVTAQHYWQHVTESGRYSDSVRTVRSGGRTPPVAWMFVLCVVSKGKMQDNEDKRKQIWMK
jgi:hypothetical protein